MNYRQSINRIQNSIFLILGTLVFAGFLVMTVWGQGGLIELIKLNQQKHKIVATNFELLKENLFLLEEIEKLQKSKFIEQKVRSDLGLVRDDEMVFVFK